GLLAGCFSPSWANSSALPTVRLTTLGNFFTTRLVSPIHTTGFISGSFSFSANRLSYFWDRRSTTIIIREVDADPRSSAFISGKVLLFSVPPCLRGGLATVELL